MKGRIMVLEDDQDTLEVLSMIFQDEGYQVYQHTLLIEDLSEVERVAPDVMLVDLFMGNKNKDATWEFIQHLKVQPTTDAIPIIICTAGRLTSEQLQQTQHQGIAVVYKPF